MDEIECIDGKWSLPDDMGPIQCKSVTCPPFPDFGNKIVTKCTKRDQACVTGGKYENIEDCSCLKAVSTCRPKFIKNWNDTFHEIEPERTSKNYRPAFKLKNETELNGWEWTSWNELRCDRFHNELGKWTSYGKWNWKWGFYNNGWSGQLSGESVIEWRESAIVPNNLFPEFEDIAVATCREYATCDYFWKGVTKDPLISTTCENVNGSEDNCDRLKFNCPEGRV